MDLGGSNKGGKKPLDAMINLVPFIDLMAVTIVFLIMTAVWTQVGSLHASDSRPGGDSHGMPSVRLIVTDPALYLEFGGARLEPLVITRDAKGHIETGKLITMLEGIKKQVPDQFSITLAADDAVKYDDLVRLMDTVVGEGEPLFPSVSIEPNYQ